MAKYDSSFGQLRGGGSSGSLQSVLRVGLAVLSQVSLIGCATAELDFQELDVTRHGVTFPGASQQLSNIAGCMPSDQVALNALDSAIATTPSGTVAQPRCGVSPSEAAALVPTTGTLVAIEELALPPQNFGFSSASTVALPDEVSASLSVRQVTIAPTVKSMNLHFLRKVVLTVTTPGTNGGRPQTLVDYAITQEEASSSAPALVLPIRCGADLVDPWRMQASVYELSVTVAPNELPWDTWAVDVTLALSGSVEADF